MRVRALWSSGLSLLSVAQVTELDLGIEDEADTPTKTRLKKDPRTAMLDLQLKNALKVHAGRSLQLFYYHAKDCP